MTCAQRGAQAGKTCLDFDPYGWGIWCDSCWREASGIKEAKE